MVMSSNSRKRAYLSAALIVISAVILWALIAITSSRTIPIDEALNSGVKGAAVMNGDCDKPQSCPPKRIAATISITDADGKSTSTKTDADGYFTIKLAPGTYTASAAIPEKSSSTAPSQQVMVQKDKFTHITFNFDSN
jgi:hypothetical protein